MEIFREEAGFQAKKITSANLCCKVRLRYDLCFKSIAIVAEWKTDTCGARVDIESLVKM